MEDKVTVNSQNANLNIFGDFLNSGLGKEFLTGVCNDLRKTYDLAKTSSLENKKIYEYDEFKACFPVFKKLYNENIDMIELCNILKLNPLEEVNKFSDVPTLLNNIKSKMQEGNNIEEVNKAMFMPNEELNRILQGIEDYGKTIEGLKKCEDDFIKRRLALVLYKDVYEIYIKILKDIYSKVTKNLSEKIDNNTLYTWLDNNYPLFRKGADNILRNDEGHLNYDVRDNYTTEELYEKAKLLLVKSFAGLLAKNEVWLELYENITSLLTQFWDLKKGEVNKNEI